MGTPIPDPDETEQCALCWGHDGPLGHLPSPVFLNVTVAGIEKGPLWTPGHGEPMNGDYILEHLYPCNYGLYDGSFLLLLGWQLGVQIGYMNNNLGRQVFVTEMFETCNPVFVNQRTGTFKNGTITAHTEGMS